MRKYALLFMLLITACGDLAANDNTVAPAKAASATEQKDFYQLLSLFLRTPTAEIAFLVDGTLQYDELKAFKLLDNLYGKYTTPDLASSGYSPNRLKVVAFFAHLAHQHNNAALNEYLASDLVPIYERSPRRFLSVLAELPFLVPSNCERLSAYFGFEGKHLNEKARFIQTNSPLMKEILGQPLAEACLSSF